jgi:hypothetical protein
MPLAVRTPAINRRDPMSHAKAIADPFAAGRR